MGLNPRQVEVDYDAQIVRRPYALEDDKWQGFNDAVHNGQVRIALEHLLPYVRDIVQRLEALEAQVQNDDQSEDAVKPAAKTKGTAKKPVVEEDSAE